MKWQDALCIKIAFRRKIEVNAYNKRIQIEFCWSIADLKVEIKSGTDPPPKKSQQVAYMVVKNYYNNNNKLRHLKLSWQSCHLYYDEYWGKRKHDFI